MPSSTCCRDARLAKWDRCVVVFPLSPDGSLYLQTHDRPALSRRARARQLRSRRSPPCVRLRARRASKAPRPPLPCVVVLGSCPFGGALCPQDLDVDARSCSRRNPADLCSETQLEQSTADQTDAAFVSKIGHHAVPHTHPLARGMCLGDLRRNRGPSSRTPRIRIRSVFFQRDSVACKKKMIL